MFDDGPEGVVVAELDEELVCVRLGVALDEVLEVGQRREQRGAAMRHGQLQYRIPRAKESIM